MGSIMGNVAKYLLILLLVTLSSCGESTKKCQVSPYEKYVNEIINSFATDMKKEYGLVCVGSGGRMPQRVEKVSVSFHAYRRATLEEARELVVKSTQKLVDRINANEKIRPYLMEYPLTWKEVDISIAFHQKGDPSSYYLDGSVAFVCRARDDKLSYCAAELQERVRPDFVYPDGKVQFGKVVEEEKFVDLMDEPYEEAKAIVRTSR